MIVDKKNKELIDSLQKLRLWEREHLPFCRTNKGYEIFLRLTNEIMNVEPRLKNIYSALPYSEVTIRVLLKHLETDGWIEFPNKKSDLRLKDILATEKFNQVFFQWINEIDSIKKLPKD